MKKFISVFDGLRMSQSTLDYTIQLAKSTGAHVTGVFLDDLLYRSYSVYDVLTTSSQPEITIKKMDEKDKEKRDSAVTQFKWACASAGILFSVHRDVCIAIQELKHETMFADLVIINKSESFSFYEEKYPTRFIKDVLAGVQCPVLILPTEFKRIDNIVLLYDGAPSSVYAAKMFSYLLGNLETLPIEVFSVKEAKNNTLFSSEVLMREFMHRHFSTVTYTLVTGQAEEEITNHLCQKHNTLVVLGAYNRGEVSRWFKPSMADVLMDKIDSPLFIAHNK